jgi:glutathionyl-hydroquinone reductase
MFATVMLPYATIYINYIELDSTHHRCENKRMMQTPASIMIYTDINNGAYKAGFSSNQDVHQPLKSSMLC